MADQYLAYTNPNVIKKGSKTIEITGSHFRDLNYTKQEAGSNPALRTSLNFFTMKDLNPLV